MRALQWILMIVGWWSGGLLLSSFTIRCRILAPAAPDSTVAWVDPRCPKVSYKIIVGSFVAIVIGGAWTLVMGWKPPVPMPDYFFSVAVSAIVGAAVARILCPLPPK
jgi:hypothetical protein